MKTIWDGWYRKKWYLTVVLSATDPKIKHGVIAAKKLSNKKTLMAFKIAYYLIKSKTYDWKSIKILDGTVVAIIFGFLPTSYNRICSYNTKRKVLIKSNNISNGYFFTEIADKIRAWVLSKDQRITEKKPLKKSVHQLKKLFLISIYIY